MRLSNLGEGPDFFGSLRCSGSHENSLRLVAEGMADAAAIDSNVLRFALETEDSPAHQLRVVESWGPYPIQPIVALSRLDTELKEGIAAGLIEAHRVPSLARRFDRHGAERFVSVGEEHYRGEREELRACHPIVDGATG